MKEIKTVDAVGHILCHDLTRIVKGEGKGPAFRKGHVVREEDIPLLLSMGKQNLFVWENEAGMLHENEAAGILYRIAAGPHMAPSEVKEGKIEVLAGTDGLFTVDIERLRRVNSLGDMMVATRHTNSPVKKGDRLAGTRVIPLVIAQEKMDRAVAAAGGAPLLALHPYRPKKVAIITTGSEVAGGLIKDTFTPVIQQKIKEFGGVEMGHTVLGDEPAAVTKAILQYVKDGAELVVCTGGMSVDPDDKTPLAIKNTGADIVTYGAPVLPGAMFMLAYLGSVPIMGLPGCVMYAARTVFDMMLARVAADVPITAADMAALGHGGLCLNCPTCIFPNCAYGGGV